MKSICVLNLLSNKRVRSFRAVREEEVNSMIEKIKESSSTSSVVNMSETFATLTNGVISRVALGRKYNTGGEGLRDLLEEFMKLLGHINVGDFIPWLAWLNRVNGLDARLDRVARQFDEFLERVIQEHVNSSESRTNGHAHTENDQKDFVDVLLEIQKENSLGFPLERVSIKALILVRLPWSPSGCITCLINIFLLYYVLYMSFNRISIYITQFYTNFCS